MKKKEKEIFADIISFIKKEDFANLKERKVLLYFLKERSVLSKDSFLKENKKELEFLVKNNIILKKKACYSLESLEGLFAWIQKKSQEKAFLAKNRAENFLDFLKSSLGSVSRLNIKFYEGIDGIKESYQHILDNAKGEVCAFYSSIETQQTELHKFFQQNYVQERSKRKIFARNITVRTPKAIFYKLKSKEILAETKMLPPENFPFLNSEITLYDNFMHCMTFDQYGGSTVIIEGENIVKMQKAIFEIIWENCDQLNKKISTKINTQVISKKHLYVIDDIKEIMHQINLIKSKVTPDLKESWPNKKAEFIKLSSKEEILKINDLKIRSSLEKPYLKKLSKIATTHGGKILNIGFRMGMTAAFIEERRKTRQLSEHHIIEVNRDLFKNAKAWREKSPYKKKIFLHKGYWDDVLSTLSKKKIIFDGILYNGYPLQIDEIYRDSVNFIHAINSLKLIKKNGIVTFYLKSNSELGEGFKKYLHSLGIEKINTEKIKIKIPFENENYDYFLAPTITNFTFKNNQFKS